MNATDDRTTYFYIHTLARGLNQRLDLLAPQRIDIPGAAPDRGSLLGIANPQA